MIADYYDQIEGLMAFSNDLRLDKNFKAGF